MNTSSNSNARTRRLSKSIAEAQSTNTSNISSSCINLLNSNHIDFTFEEAGSYLKKSIKSPTSKNFISSENICTKQKFFKDNVITNKYPDKISLQKILLMLHFQIRKLFSSSVCYHSHIGKNNLEINTIHLCFARCMRGFVRGFLIAFSTKFAFSILGTVSLFYKILTKYFSRNIGLNQTINSYYKTLILLLKSNASDSIRFASCISSFIGLYFALNCALRRQFCDNNLSKDAKNKKYSTYVRDIIVFLSGFFAGFIAILIDQKSRRKTFTFYLLVRCLYFGLNLFQPVSHNIYSNSKLDKARAMLCNGRQASSNTQVVLFCLTCCQIMYAQHFHSDTLPQTYYKQISHKGNIDYRIKMGTRAVICNEDPKFYLDSQCREHKIAELPCSNTNFIPCSILHPDSKNCFLNIFYRQPKIFLKCLPVYIPIHLFPSIIFRFKKFLKNPFSNIRRIIVSILRSTLFLSNFPIIFWIVFCKIRNILGRDAKINTLIAGFISGLAILIEKPNRRIELVLFCLPRAIESMIAILKKKGMVNSVPYLLPLITGCSSGLLTTIYFRHRHAISSTYCYLLKCLFGE